MSRTDVLLVAQNHEAGTIEDWTRHPIVGDPAVRLPNGVLIASPATIDVEQFMDACEVRGLNDEPVRQYGARFLFLRENAPGGYRNWDADQAILTAMAMTRLVVPHAYSTDYAGSIVKEAGRDRSIEPLSGSAKWSGWTPAPTRRNWLDQNDAAAVVRLVQRYLDDRDELPPRVGRALWLHEYLTQVRWLDIAWPLTVTALEALLNTDKHGQRAQFIRRAKALARELLVPGIDDDFLDRAYTSRCEAIHGLQVAFGDNPDASRELALLQRVLRDAIRRAIENRAWRLHFADAAAIRAKWPI
jgi:hypothetical protein